MKITAELVKVLREKTSAGMLDCKKALEASEGDVEKAVVWLREKGITKAEAKGSRVAAEGICNFAINGNEAVIFELNSETDFVAKNDKFIALVETISNALLNSKVTNTEEALALKVDGKEITALLLEATAVIGEKISLRRVSRIIKTDSQVFGSYKHMGGRIASLVVLEGKSEEVARDLAMHVAAINPKYTSSNDISDDIIKAEKEILLNEALNENEKADKPKPQNIIENIVNGRLNKYLKEICLLNQPFVKNPDQTVEAFVKANGSTVSSFNRLEVGEGIEKEVVDFAAEVAAQAGLNK